MSTEAKKPSLLGDLVALGKPGISSMNVLMAAGGYGLAAVSRGWIVLLHLTVGTTLLIFAANALNMYLERDSDGLMNRTRDRPITAGRLPAWVAVAYGSALGAASLVELWLFVNPLTSLLGLVAFVSYVGVYTPMKRRSRQALYVGAIPGAIPPLMGWTAATGQIELPGVVLFLILLFWQIPHFIAIAIYRQVDYEKAGIKVVTSEKGPETAKVHAMIYSTLLVAVSLLLVPLGVAGFFYFIVASALGCWFFILNIRGFEPESGNRWARRFFLASIVYLPAITLALVLDVLLMGA